MSGEQGDCDVVVIGGGPAGLRTSAALAQAGLRVVLAEEHVEVGEPRHCTGIVGKASFDLMRLPKEVIQHQLRSAIAISPQGARARLSRRRIQAYVVDRAALDQRLFRQAVVSGAQPLIGHRCVSVCVTTGGVSADLVSSQGVPRTLVASVLVIATGAQYRLHRQVGLASPRSFLASSQTEVQIDGAEETELYFGRDIAEGSFAWMVPLSNHVARVGVTAAQHAPRYMERLLRSPWLAARVKAQLRPIRHRPIPIQSVESSVADRVVLVGDAAGQVKPMTGGGIYYSLLCADLAAQAIIRAFNAVEFSRSSLGWYEEQWRKAIDFELKAGWYLRQLLSKLEDAELEALIAWIKHPHVSRLIQLHANFDWHARLIQSIVKQPMFWSVIYKCLQPQLKTWFFRNLLEAEPGHARGAHVA